MMLFPPCLAMSPINTRCSFYMDELSVTVAMANFSDLDAIDGLGQALGMEVNVNVADEERLRLLSSNTMGWPRTTVSSYYRTSPRGRQISTIGEVDMADDDDVVDADTPIIKLVNTLIAEAFDEASISTLNQWRIGSVRYRIDGVCHDNQPHPVNYRLQSSVV